MELSAAPATARAPERPALVQLRQSASNRPSRTSSSPFEPVHNTSIKAVDCFNGIARFAFVTPARKTSVFARCMPPARRFDFFESDRSAADFSITGSPRTCATTAPSLLRVRALEAMPEFGELGGATEAAR